MFDFRSYFQIVQSSAQAMAKAMHNPSLQSKESMVAYAKATGNTGKAKFIGMDDDLACYQLDFTL